MQLIFYKLHDRVGKGYTYINGIISSFLFPFGHSTTVDTEWFSGNLDQLYVCTKKLNIGVIDLVAKGPNSSLWAKIMYANLASIMPQVVATWCEEQGHEVKMIC